MSKNNELALIKNAIFMLLCQLESNVAENISKDKVDAQVLFALAKLVDSFLKLSHIEASETSEDKKNLPMSQEDKILLDVYKSIHYEEA